MMAEDPLLGGLVPVEPEELLTRGALGAPGRLRIEVGLAEPRFASPEGRRTPREELALRRALGGVSYPAPRERLLIEAGRWLAGHEDLRERLRDLPELTYGSELEVLGQLQAQVPRAASEPEGDHPSDADPPSSRAGKDEGSSASR